MSIVTGEVCGMMHGRPVWCDSPVLPSLEMDLLSSTSLLCEKPINYKIHKFE